MCTLRNLLTLNIEVDCPSEKEIYEKLDSFMQFLIKNKIEGHVHIFLNKKEYHFDDDTEG